MGHIITALLVVNALVLGVVGLALWIAYRIVKGNLIEPKRVFEEPSKEKIVLIPGKGVFGIQNKRPVKVMDEKKEWLKEQQERERERRDDERLF
jgi:hypothetical protein